MKKVLIASCGNCSWNRPAALRNGNVSKPLYRFDNTTGWSCLVHHINGNESKFKPVGKADMEMGRDNSSCYADYHLCSTVGNVPALHFPTLI